MSDSEHNGPATPPEAVRPQEASLKRQRKIVLLCSVVVISICGLIYELLSATLSSYLLGDSVFHFSLVIGLFLSSMGIGAFLSKLVTRRLIRNFILVEILVGLVGGFSGLLLFAAFTYQWNFWAFLIFNCVAVGALVGIEIPLIIRLLQDLDPLRVNVGNVLGYDYIGSLLASILFPAVLVPQLGLMRTSFLFGLINIAVAWVAWLLFRDELKKRAPLLGALVLTTLLLVAGLLGSARLTHWLEEDLYQDTIILSRSTPYQRMVVTSFRNDIRLYLNGNLQFSSVDEFRYHESLVHPAVSLANKPKTALILGGGDGLALRELLRYPSISRVDLVDLDALLVSYFRDHPTLRRLNKSSLRSPRVRLHYLDAMKFVERNHQRYDLIFVDLPDPRTLSLGKIYSLSFFRLLKSRLAPGGAVALQATSPIFSRRTFWCIVNTIRKAGYHAHPYHVNVPSFSEWGFVLAATRPFEPRKLSIQVSGRFLTTPVLHTLFVFPPDIGPLKTAVNRLDNQILVKYFTSDARRWDR